MLNHQRVNHMRIFSDPSAPSLIFPGFKIQPWWSLMITALMTRASEGPSGANRANYIGIILQNSYQKHSKTIIYQSIFCCITLSKTIMPTNIYQPNHWFFQINHPHPPSSGLGLVLRPRRLRPGPWSNLGASKRPIAEKKNVNGHKNRGRCG